MSDPVLWGVVPAAGLGERFGGACPKQYCHVAGTPVLAWSLRALLAVPGLKGVCVPLNPADERWAGLTLAGDSRVFSCTGGDERHLSVRAGLRELLAQGARRSDRVLVHDAARPGLEAARVEQLVEVVGDDPHGGLLALPLRDTLKRADADGTRVDATIARQGLWTAQTPQYFPLGALLDALDAAAEKGVAPTDEAAVMEHAGYRPRLVPGSLRNLKLTHADDLPVLEALLGASAVATAAGGRA